MKYLKLSISVQCGMAAAPFDRILSIQVKYSVVSERLIA